VKKFIDLKSNNPICADRSLYECNLFIDFYYVVQLIGLKVLAYHCECAFETNKKKTPIADYEQNQFYLGLYSYTNTIPLK
jgi:hypothetical protein